MTDTYAALGQLVVAHYGKALKEVNRDARGSHAVYGSSGEVGRHTQPLTLSPTIVIGRKGSVGAVTYAPKGGWPIDTTYYLEIRDPDYVDLRYLYWALTNARLGRRAITTSIPGLNREELYRTRILMPPRGEQRRIAEMLDRMDAVLRKRQESLRLLDEFLRSAFLEMFGEAVERSGVRNLPPGWRLATVESVAARTANACAGGPFGSTLTRADYIATPGVPVIRGNNLVADRAVFREENFVFVSDAKADALRRNVAVPGDIIFTQRGTLGQVARIPSTAKYPRYIISQSQMKVTLNDDVVDPTYFVHYFLSPRAWLELESRALATGVPHINLAILRAFTVVLPPLALQRRFSALATRHARARKALEMASCDARKLADSLVDAAFRSEPKKSRL